MSSDEILACIDTLAAEAHVRIMAADKMRFESEAALQQLVVLRDEVLAAKAASEFTARRELRKRPHLGKYADTSGFLARVHERSA